MKQFSVVEYDVVPVRRDLGKQTVQNESTSRPACGKRPVIDRMLTAGCGVLSPRESHKRTTVSIDDFDQTARQAGKSAIDDHPFHTCGTGGLMPVCVGLGYMEYIFE